MIAFAAIIGRSSTGGAGAGLQLSGFEGIALTPVCLEENSLKRHGRLKQYRGPHSRLVATTTPPREKRARLGPRLRSRARVSG